MAVLTYLRIHLLGLIRISLTLLFMARIFVADVNSGALKQNGRARTHIQVHVLKFLLFYIDFRKKTSLSFAGLVFFVFKSCIIICFFEGTYLLSLISVTA